MKKYLLFTIVLALSLPKQILAQCGEVGVDNFIYNQEQLLAFSDCEIINGNLIVSSVNVTDLNPLSNLVAINGSFYLLNSGVTDLSPVAGLNNAVQILIQGNSGLTSCCEILQYVEVAQLGTIMNVSYSDNGTQCSDVNTIMMDCWGYIEGCTDTVALNYNELASQDDGSCEYFCPESIDDIGDYSCGDEAYPNNCEEKIINEPNEGAGHYNNPIGLCYDSSPPSSGPHRPMWGKWGEYEYMPPQRYIHNLEHGGIAFLYHPCADEALIDSLRTIACSRAEDDGGEFRWVLTPYIDLPTNIAVVAWEWTYSNDCFDAQGINDFIDEHYRNAPEDFYYNGSYDTLYIGKCEAYGCTDPEALNYDVTALLDNGQCEYPILDTQLVVLGEGWNIFSTYIQPLNDSMLVVFDEVISQTTIVKNNNGEAMLPDWGIDITMEDGEGYQSKMLSQVNLEITGVQIVPEQHPIFLEQGWNLLGYLRENPADIELVLQDVVANVIIVKDEFGNVYYPEWGFNNIGTLEAGKGYQLKMSSADVLLYIGNDEEY